MWQKTTEPMAMAYQTFKKTRKETPTQTISHGCASLQDYFGYAYIYYSNTSTG